MKNNLFQTIAFFKHYKITAHVVRMCLLVMLLLSVSLPVHAKPKIIIGIIAQAVRGVSIEDIELGVNYELEKVSEDRAYSIKAKLYSNAKQLAESLRQKKVHGFFGPPNFYIKYMDLFDAKYLYAPVINNNIANKYMVLVRKDSGVNSVSELENLTMTYSLTDEIGSLYIKKLLLKEKSNDPNEFFGKVLVKRNPSLAISAVFFKKADATLVLESDFSIASELNPQLKEQLTAIKTSDPYVINMLAVAKLDDSVKAKRMGDLIIKLGNTLKGNSLLKAYFYDEIRAIKVEDLDNINAMISAHAKSGKLKR